MPRKKPFSGKAKKAQLQAKRERKKEDGGEEDEVLANTTKTFLVIDKLNAQPVSDRAARDINRYKLHFSHESKADIEQRKTEARKPLRMLPQRCLEVGIEDIFGDEQDKVIDIPKRPPWDYSMSKEEVEKNEEKAFHEWLHTVHERYGENVSHFEHNLETWRQLWRVLEISDIILLLTDIRHPVLHFPPALYRFVVEDMKKDLVLVLNKIDLVAPATVDAWRDYFQAHFPKLHIACFTSYPQDQPQDIEQVFWKKRGRTKKSRQMVRGADQVLTACEACMVQKHGETFKFSDWRARMDPANGEAADEADAEDGGDYESDSDDDVIVDAPELGQLADDEMAPHKDYVTIGVVGNPNVGKSSLLNGLMGKKVVSTSRTPGHTKHFQTIFLTPNVRLCDSPGLVFPSCVPKQLQVLSGIYPVAQVREPFTAIGYLAERVPLVDTLKLEWPYDDDEYDGHKEWSAWIICDAWAKKRGYVTAKAARLDTYRAANSLLRLAVDGRIVLSIKPPGFFDRIKEQQEKAEDNNVSVDKSDEDRFMVESDDDEPSHLHVHSNPFAMLDHD